MQISHHAPLWMTVENPNGTGRRVQLQPDIPFDIAFGAGKKILIDDFREVIITLINHAGVAVGEVPYGMLADSDGWVSIDTLAQE